MKYNISDDFQKLEEAGILPYGLIINVTSTQNVNDFFVGDDDTEKYMMVEVTLENYIQKENEEIHEVYGNAKCLLITTFDEVTGRTLNYMDVIDSIDQDTFNGLSVFMNHNCEFDSNLMFSQIFYIDKITIYEKYRNIGLGSILLEYLKYRFANLITAIVLQPLAFEVKDKGKELFDKESERLCRFYKKHGFENYREKTWVYYEF
jgi:GNAT superfamily N-acetyltransferase